jgi:hypothetical protein
MWKSIAVIYGLIGGASAALIHQIFYQNHWDKYYFAGFAIYLSLYLTMIVLLISAALRLRRNAPGQADFVKLFAMSLLICVITALSSTIYDVIFYAIEPDYDIRVMKDIELEVRGLLEQTQDSTYQLRINQVINSFQERIARSQANGPPRFFRLLQGRMSLFLLLGVLTGLPVSFLFREIPRRTP